MSLIKLRNLFFSQTEKQFLFLNKNFGMTLHKKEISEGAYSIYYKNDATGVKINLDLLDQLITVYICKLVLGEFSENKIETSPMIVFALSSITSFMGKENDAYKITREVKTTHEFIEKNLIALAADLKKYCANILKGDFSIFPILDLKHREYLRDYFTKRYGIETAKLRYSWLFKEQDKLIK